jgi:predicted GNAT family acetyltransferase
VEVRPFRNAEPALALVGDQLRGAGAEGELSYGILLRLADDPGAWGEQVTILVGLDGDRPLALVTMTGPFPALIVGFEDPGAVDLAAFAEAMLGSGRRPTAVNGARRWSEPFAETWQTLGADVHVGREMRAFELTRVRPPRRPQGGSRPATEADRELLERWIVAFGDDIREEVTAGEAADAAERLLDVDDALLWEAGGEPVSLAAIVRRTPLSSTIAYVYTPPELRGRGFASAVVADLSQRELDRGAAWCSLFTDLANPTSNHIYAEIGYEPRADFRLFELAWPAG